MLKLEPITTSNFLSILQIIVVIIGFYFSWRSLNTAVTALSLGTKNAQAQLFNQMVLQGRDLQYKFMDIYLPEDISGNVTERQRLYTGTVIGYYASCFELRNVLELPEQIQKLLDSEIRELMRQKNFREKWNEVKNLHSQKFVSYVESNVGIK